ncbi:unnamed protein product [Parascedosporium putredinis]|uniref:RRM domain-containing protein n=1 Tax=Parascedosporium putredinis TaxID=1442378 RepID=A0A9P1MBG5_9PEZI|nr:unnamed protein product [Parascedosporium putredinis]CAI7995865.1 unnamed protein product [Parascedosporium putredinis]
MVLVPQAGALAPFPLPGSPRNLHVCTAAASPPKGGGGLSLYANLLESSGDASATISGGPVLYGDAPDTQSVKKAIDPALRFQPIRRPQVKQKPKPSFPKTIPGALPSKANPGVEPTGREAPKGGRKKKKKWTTQMETDWDEIYDPSRPTNVDEYLKSDERIQEIHEWKDLLYRHRKGKEEDLSSDSDDDHRSRPMPSQFAPPPSYAFAPPPPPSPPRAPASVPDDRSGDDAYARRLAMSQGIPPPSASAPPPPPPTGEQGATISRAPVRYNNPPPPQARDAEHLEDDEDDDDDDDEQGFRPSLGLGASSTPADGGEQGGDGRIRHHHPLRVQVEKRKKKADADGGGWAEPSARSKILGGNRKLPQGRDADDGFGAMSEVIVLRNMLEGMEDLRGEISSGLGQEIGEECGDKYGRVERLYIDIDTKQVFIKFTDQVSALRAVNELNGRVFNGNPIQAKFYDPEKFEKAEYN